MHVPHPLKIAALCLVIFASVTSVVLGATTARRVLVYTRNQVGKGLYVHDNIAASVAAIKKLGSENNFAVDVSDDPKSFTDSNLSRYKALIFDNCNNEIFDTEEQKAAFQRYIRAGGGFVGIHSTSGAMRQWPWFWEMLGGKFLRHPKLQAFTIKVKDPKDPSTTHLPPSFQWTDEFYFLDNLADGLHFLLAGDLTTLDDPQKEKYPGKKFGDEFPLAWRHEFDGGREWYTALGHKAEYYSDPKLTQHILGGILWAMGESK
jgi:type 1 glutamine amidotransferase